MKIVSGFSVEITIEEVLKRLVQMGPKAPLQNASKRTRKDVNKFIEKSRSWIKPRGVYEIFNCKVRKNRLILNNGEGILTSTLLAKVFKNSKKVGVFVVTIGKDLEENAKYYSGRQELSIIDAIGSAAVNRWALYIHRQIIDPHLVTKPKLTTTRLYPGVGDWFIEEQRIIFKLLGSEERIEKLIGVTLTSGFLMNPNKSISAIVGIKK